MNTAPIIPELPKPSLSVQSPDAEEDTPFLAAIDLQSESGDQAGVPEQIAPEKPAAPIAGKRKVRLRFRYTKQFKQEAVRKWKASGESAQEIAATLGLNPLLIYRWGQKFKRDLGMAATGETGQETSHFLHVSANPTLASSAPGKNIAGIIFLKDEIINLRREVELLSERCDMLKRAVDLLSGK